MEKVCILIPTLNEEESIGEIVREFKERGFEDILVFDGNSTDSTREIARREGARVEVQRGKGKGTAIREAFELIDAETEAEVEMVVMIDGDGTYLPSEVDKLLKPIINGKADHVIGNRFGFGGAFTWSHRIGNRMVNKVFGFGYGVRLNDILSGYRAFTMKCIRRMNLQKSGFEIETEMAIESVKKGERIKEVPITYKKRKGESKLGFFKDGSRIAHTLYMLTKTHNPMFYFGIIGFIFLIIGLLSGTFVVIRWLEGITHVLLTIFTAMMIMSGVQFFMFGVFGDLLVTVQKDTIEMLRDRDRDRDRDKDKDKDKY
ncbi:MAG: S-layer glycoprotein N-glycosyltransferase AglJ [Methanophagales archaeon]|nr:S-layer glycoprotein N-glycosyltransferase AglJ [Methanophagales archaeon]